MVAQIAGPRGWDAHCRDNPGATAVMTLACSASNFWGWLLAVIDGQQYNVTPPDAWWCVLLGGTDRRCPDGDHDCERGGTGHSVCTRCGAIQEIRLAKDCDGREGSAWMHVGSEEHESAMRRIAAAVLRCDSAHWPLSLFADEGELLWAAAPFADPSLAPLAHLPAGGVMSGELLSRPADQLETAEARWYRTGVLGPAADCGRSRRAGLRAVRRGAVSG